VGARSVCCGLWRGMQLAVPTCRFAGGLWSASGCCCCLQREGAVTSVYPGQHTRRGLPVAAAAQHWLL
jgi:hypothetical protein